MNDKSLPSFEVGPNGHGGLMGSPIRWFACVPVAALLALASVYIPVLTLSLLLLVLILGIMVRSLVKRDYFSILSWVGFGYIGFALGGFYYATSGAVYEYGFYPYDSDPGVPIYASLPENQRYLILALVITVIGLLSFATGYFVWARRRTNNPGSSLIRHHCSRRRLFLAVTLMSILGLCFVYLYFESSGGFLYLLTHIYGRTFFRTTAYLTWGALLLPVANLVWFSYDYTKARKSLLFWLHAAFVSLVLVSFGDRWGIVGFWLMLLVIHYYLSGRQVKLRALVVIGTVCLVLALAVIVWRAAASAGNRVPITSLDDVSKSLPDITRMALGDRNLTDIDVLAWIVGRGHEEIGWLWGSSFFQVIFAPLPRSLFPDKPDELGQVILRTYTGTEVLSAWHPSLVGELYLNFLLPGVVFGMFFFGLASSWIEWQKWRSPTPYFVLLYAIFTVKFVVLLVTVDFLMSFLQAIFYAIPVVVASFYICRTSFRLR